MTSKSLLQGKFLEPDALSEPSSEGSTRKQKRPRARRVNVYDAVAGNISAAGFVSQHPKFGSFRDTPSSSVAAVPPEAVLFRSQNAPTRYAENDFYFANEKQSMKDLPESDLLKALHCYVSDFYSHAVVDGTYDWKSLDETALIAVGILMEEAVKESLSKTGDLAFTEGEEVPEPMSSTTQRTESGGAEIRPTKKRRIKT